MAGMLRMPYPRFLAANAAGGIAWATTIGIVAFKVGDNADKIFGKVSVWALVVLAVAAVAAYAGYKIRRSGDRAAVPAEAEPQPESADV